MSLFQLFDDPDAYAGSSKLIAALDLLKEKPRETTTTTLNITGNHYKDQTQHRTVKITMTKNDNVLVRVECDCNYMVSMGLPCKHAITGLKDQRLSVYQPSMFAERWKLDMDVEGKTPETIRHAGSRIDLVEDNDDNDDPFDDDNDAFDDGNDQQDRRASPLPRQTISSTRKYNMTHEILKKISALVSNERGGNFDKIWNILEHLLEKLEKGDVLQEQLFMEAVGGLQTRAQGSRAPSNRKSSSARKPPPQTMHEGRPVMDPASKPGHSGKTALRKKSSTEVAQQKRLQKICSVCGIRGHIKGNQICQIRGLGDRMIDADAATRNLPSISETQANARGVQDFTGDITKQNIRVIQVVAEISSPQTGYLCCMYGKHLRPLGKYRLAKTELFILTKGNNGTSLLQLPLKCSFVVDENNSCVLPINHQRKHATKEMLLNQNYNREKRKRARQQQPTRVSERPRAPRRFSSSDTSEDEAMSIREYATTTSDRRKKAKTASQTK